MDILSPLTVTFFAVIAAVTFGLTWWYTPRLVGSALKAFARGALILCSAITMLLAVALQQNMVNGWYSTWGGVVGATGTSEEAQAGGSVQDALQAEKTPTPIPALRGVERPSSYPPLPRPGSRDQLFSKVKGKASGLTGDIGVILPEGYDAPGNTASYPVVMALHGAPGSYTGWTKRMHPKEHIDPMVSGGKVRPHILVVPRHDFPADRDTECLDGPAGTPQVETWLMKDVIPYVASRLRVDTERTSWATAGYSAGGYCAAMLAYRHHETFSAGLVMAGYFTPQFLGTPVYRKGAPELVRYNLVTQASKGKNPPVALWVQAGRESENWKENQAFKKAATAPLSVTMIEETGSGHSWSYWESRLGEAFAWLGAHIPGFSPSAATQPAPSSTQP